MKKIKQDGGQNVLNDKIKTYVLKKVPTDVTEVYKDVLKNIKDSINSLLRILHKFIHKDSDKLKLSPMPRDIEAIYFLTCHLIKYLASF